MASCVNGQEREMRRKFHVVGTDPSDIFDDLDALRKDDARPGPTEFKDGDSGGGVRRSKAKETFARFPHDRALALWPHVGGAAWAVLIELDRALLRNRGRNPIRLSGRNLKTAGLSSSTQSKALRELETAGVIRIHERGRGRRPLVEHLWYPTQL
jgi:hypothetical protein